MKKILILVLIGFLCLTLVGCGNNNSGNYNNQNNSSNNNNNDADPKDPDQIPNNGASPQVSGNLKSHSGDKGYFYTTTDDYIIYTKAETFGNYSYIKYIIQSFDTDGMPDLKGNSFKIVFENNSKAKEFADSENGKQNTKGYIAIDNVVYITRANGFNYEIGVGYYGSRAALADFLYNKTYFYDKSSYDDYYMSKP